MLVPITGNKEDQSEKSLTLPIMQITSKQFRRIVNINRINDVQKTGRKRRLQCDSVLY